LADLAAAWLGCSPDELAIERARSGRSTPIFQVGLGGLSCFLRLSETPTASLGPEALAHEVILSYGARVPAVIGYEPFDRVLERSVMLTTTIPGSSLDDALPADPSSVLRAAGADLARIDQVPAQGFGWIDRTDPLPTRLSAPFQRWADFAAELTAQPLDGWFEPALLARLAALAQLEPPDPTHAVLAHGDFDTSHIFELDGRYSGIIDFGEIRGAEPTFDLGHLALHAPEAFPSVLQGYSTVTPIAEDAMLQIAASAIRIGWFRLTQSSARTNPPYADLLTHGMTRIVAAPTFGLDESRNTNSPFEAR
jgi:aminoglycoside phosphotransferase (APT) family kinase protein